jgi:hypothetical protein
MSKEKEAILLAKRLEGENEITAKKSLKIKEIEEALNQNSRLLSAQYVQKKNTLRQKAEGFKAKTRELSDKARVEGVILKNRLAKSGVLKGMSGGLALRGERKTDNKTGENIFGLEKDLSSNLSEIDNSLSLNEAQYNDKLSELSQSTNSKKAKAGADYKTALQKLYDSLEVQRKTYQANELKKKLTSK